MWKARIDIGIIEVSLGALVLTGALAGCSQDAVGPADYSLVGDGQATYFLTQPVVPNAFMDALYQGKVTKDGGGCLRLQPPGDATVIWPYGFTLDAREGQEWVVDAGNKDVGRIGGIFRFGGGEVPYLHEGLGFTPEASAQIEATCPGRFWIVGEVP